MKKPPRMVDWAGISDTTIHARIGANTDSNKISNETSVAEI